MEIKIIKTEQEHKIALTRIEEIFEAKSGTPEEEELSLLVLVVGDYEDKHYLIGPPDPIEAIKFRMEQMDMKKKDLIPAVGFTSRVSDILNKKRKLTLPMMRRINVLLKIPMDTLVQDYTLEA